MGQMLQLLEGVRERRLERKDCYPASRIVRLQGEELGLFRLSIRANPVIRSRKKLVDVRRRQPWEVQMYGFDQQGQSVLEWSLEGTRKSREAEPSWMLTVEGTVEK